MRPHAITIFLLAAVFAAPAHAAKKVAPLTLMPGVTYEKGVQFTPHGAVAIHIIRAPRPGSSNGLYGFGPSIARGTVVGGKARVTQIEKDVSAVATVAGINGDLYNWDDSHPSGIYMEGGVLKHPPLTGRSSIGVDSTGGLRVDRVRFFGTWRGTGQRRPLAGLNDVPTGSAAMLFTPAWGATTPRVANAAEVVLQPFPEAAPNTDLAGVVTAAAVGGGSAIPPDGAVLMAVGPTAPRLQAEAPVGTTITSRLILQPDWGGVVDALGGGPVLIRGGRPVFRSLEAFTSDQISPRNPRAGVGQTADGRIILVAVDGRQPGYSVGMSTFELAQTLVRLGAVTGSAVDSGGSVTVAFDGQLLNRPSDPGGERPVKEALLVKYYGVYAPPPPLPVVGADTAGTGETLTYKIVRPSRVSATVIGPDQVAHPLEAEVEKQPGTYAFPWSAFDAEGTWHWSITAVDDLGRQSAIDRPFQYDLTLSALTVPRTTTRNNGLTVGFVLSRPARVALRIETKLGTVVRALPAVQLRAGSGSLRWDAGITGKTKAFPGAYVARVVATSDVGTMDLTAPFTLRK